MTAPVTRVALVFVPQRMNVYLRFGRTVREQIIDNQRRVVEFSPAAIFCRIRWEANDYGTTLWQLSVLQTASPGEKLQRIAGIAPGATLLLHVDGARRVQTVLRLIDDVEGQKIDPADVASAYWRMAHNRLAARVDVAPYTLDRHAAHLLRRRFA